MPKMTGASAKADIPPLRCMLLNAVTFMTRRRYFYQVLSLVEALNKDVARTLQLQSRAKLLECRLRRIKQQRKFNTKYK